MSVTDRHEGDPDRHGGELSSMRRRFPDAPEPWIDLSTGINPWPWPARETHFKSLDRLPSTTDIAACTAAMAAAFGARQETVLAAPGSELLIRLLPSVMKPWLKPRRVVILAPSYGDHADVWKQAGCELVETGDPLTEAAAADAMVICNPNNPDGRRFERAELTGALNRLNRRGGWLIVDEAFADLEPELSLAPMAGSGNLLVLRSIGKFFGLAGLRLGALLAPAGLRQAMAERLGFWCVSAPALSIGAAAYSDISWQTQTRTRLAAAARRLRNLLEQGHCRVVGGTDLFQYVETEDAHQVWTHLADRGIYVRRFSWSRRHLRIGIPPDACAEERLAEALASKRSPVTTTSE
ncbi:MAG: threonine-phosphate decarboxylase CobD [Gammaproteobacteria bacterium]|nr:threonine-phosphate decarboxylase CobD [Gammaproteobacteria bacterium]MXX06721.1 threonine-phosphate decarboxylase [Gammaproteobacteria bacterium]MYE29272.1 threonine-phosphate decarboxylase [Gammaproteobacteria bacterium]